MRLRFWLGSALAAVLLVVGVQGVAQATSRPIFSKASEYTAAEYFDGIYFGVGPVAERVPQLHEQRSPGDQAEAAEAAAELRAHIEAESPRFLATFAATMRSGDQVAIRAALIEGAERLAAAHQLYHARGGDAMPAAPCNLAACALAVALAVVVWAALWVSEWAWMEGTPVEGGDPLPQARADLYLDEAAQVIATELAAR
jgi:SdpC family antimicrobial peptide